MDNIKIEERQSCKIFFKSELNALIWLKSVLEKEQLISEFRAKVNKRNIVLDLVLLEGNKRDHALTILELKPGTVTSDMVEDKILRKYPEAIALNFSLPRCYSLCFVGSDLDSEAEEYIDYINHLDLTYPSRSGVQKTCQIEFKTYQEVIQNYINRHCLTVRQISLIRKTYHRLSGHSTMLPWLDVKIGTD